MIGSKAWIAGCSGPRLTIAERDFFERERPWGFILFSRNIESADQLRDLVAALKQAGGRTSTPIFIDQEGGRIQRLRPPLAPVYLPPASLGRLHASEPDAGERAAWLQGRLFAFDLLRYGINANCLPCLDTPVPGASSVIGDRAYSSDPRVIVSLGRAAANGLVTGGVLPVMKHIPGHGRGNADSHYHLPVVSASRDDMSRTDFAPFAELRALPAAMTAHLLYDTIDATYPATLSPRIIEDVIRGEIGFDGLLLTDDISMKALQGDVGYISAQAIAAGCDIVLHCNGDMEEMRKVASAVPPLSGSAERRAQAAEAIVKRAKAAGAEAELRSEFDRLVARVA